MKTIAYILFLSWISLSSCLKVQENSNSNENDKLEFSIKKSNSQNDYESKVISIKRSDSKKHWSKHFSGGSASINQEEIFEAILLNGEKVNISFWFHHHDFEIEKLNLLNKSTGGEFGEAWSFKSVKTDADFFYRNCDIRFTVNESNTIFNDDKTIKVINVEPKEIDGTNKSLIKIIFNGNANGVYDPSGLNMPVYKISNGEFIGLI